MESQVRLLWLSLAFAPYAALAGYDGWLHEKARVVPRIEQTLHAGLAIALIAFVVLVMRAQTLPALIAFGLFTTILLFDELGFHAPLARHERRIHWLADTALVGFVLFWLWLDGAIG
jgi:hypothetical protein